MTLTTLAGCNGGEAQPPIETLSAVLQSDVTARHARLVVIHNFGGPPDGAGPLGSLLEDKSGALYGLGYDGGSYNGCGTIDGCGVAFKLTPSGTGYSESILWSFGGPGDGEHPRGALIEDASRALYGTTEYGGAYGDGAAFKLTPARSGKYSESVIYSFCKRPSCADGQTPLSGLVADATGALYGTTSGLASANNAGNVFKLTPAGSTYAESVLLSFDVKDGYAPAAALLEDKSGALYGTTTEGGTNDLGTVFRLSRKAKKYTERILLAFNQTNGRSPDDSVIEDANGALYGTTIFGGAYPCRLSTGCGVVFKLTPSGSKYTESVLWNFGTGHDGFWPIGGVIESKHGVLYGTTTDGGTHVCGNASSQRGCGTIFKLTRSGTRFSERVLWNFHGKDGYAPVATLISDANGAFFGSTFWGGTAKCAVDVGCGTIFKFRP